MKALTMIGVAALASLSMVAQASAASINPPSTSFTGVGTTQLTKGSLTIGCKATFKGVTDAAGNATITAATFSPGNILCSGITATGLPWPVTVTGPSTATINNVSVSASIFGTCSGVVPVAISGGAITFNTTLAPDCVVSTTAAIVTTPTVSIVWP